MLFVVLYHSCVFWSGSWFTVVKISASSSFYSFFCEWLNHFHVYGFTIASGFIFAYQRIEKNRYHSFKRLLQTKAKRLLVPYIVLTFVWVIPITQLFYHYSVRELVERYALGVSPSQLWFLLMLFGVFVITWPLIPQIIQGSIKTNIIIILLYQLIGIVGSKITANYYCIWTACEFTCYFILGIMLYLKRDRIISLRFSKLSIFVCSDIVLFLAIHFICADEYNLAFKLILFFVRIISKSLGGLCAFIILHRIFYKIFYKHNEIREYHIFKLLSRSSMTVYLFHQQLIFVSIYLLHNYLPTSIIVGINFMVSIIFGVILDWFLGKYTATRFLLGR